MSHHSEGVPKVLQLLSQIGELDNLIGFLSLKMIVGQFFFQKGE